MALGVPSLPTFQGVMEEVATGLPDDVGFLVVNHLRNDTVAFLRTLSRIRPTKFVSIPYSVDAEAGRTLRAEGLCFSTPADLAEMTPSILVALSEHEDRKWIVIDVGGYFADVLKTASNPMGVVGIVEETKAGIWRYDASGGHLPVVDVARCELKRVEAMYVGLAVVRAVEAELAEEGAVLRGQTFGVLGYGDVGASVAREARARGAQVLVHDTSAKAQLRSVGEGFAQVPREEVLAASTIICGATGRPSLHPEDVPELRQDVRLFSASSRSVEFSEVMSRSLRIYNDGHPINFKWTSLPHSIGDLLFSLVAAGIGQVLSSPPAVQELGAEAQETVARLWLENWGRA